MSRRHPASIEPRARLRLLELAASELLESETNGSMLLGVSGTDCEPLVVSALGCSVLVGLTGRCAVLMAISALRTHGSGGPRALAESCDRALRMIHHLPANFTVTLSFDVPENASRFLARLC